MKYTIALSLLILAPPAFAARPNVIVVMTDDQGYGEFSCNGNPLAKTPNIDALAAASIRLTDFHVAPMCTPTRGQLMTGIDALRNAASNVSSGRTLLRPELKTMADVFRAGGYTTGIFGKWHLGDNYPFRPEDRGFDETIWFPSSHINSVPDFWDNDYFHDTFIHNGHREQYAGYCTDVFFSEAIQWMKSTAGSKPFFTYIALNAAHWPWFVPEEYRDPIRESLKEQSELVSKLDAKQREDLVSFLAMGANIDHNFGRLDHFLTEAGLMDNTIVVFLTDNGSTMGQDYFNAGMRGKKTQLWEGGHRVPCFMRWPSGDLGAPREIDELCQVQDLLPTLADLSGIDSIPDNLDGLSLGPLLREKVKTLGERMLVINYSRMPQFKVSYTTGNPATPQKNGAGVLWQKWRLLENRELYNVALDPHQDQDVASIHPEVVSKMQAHLDQWWDAVKGDVMTPQRVVIGSEFENPMLLTACEWLDVFVDQQVQIRRGDRKNGTWMLHVDQPGEYELELRRWPRESGLKLRDRAVETQVTDGSFVAGPSLPITTAAIHYEGKDVMLSPDPSEEAFTTRVTFRPGPLELRTSLFDSEGKEICGAFYVYVHRLRK